MSRTANGVVIHMQEVRFEHFQIFVAHVFTFTSTHKQCRQGLDAEVNLAHHVLEC